MTRIMTEAAVTMNQLQQKLDIIGHNLANSQTTGYKSRQAEFSSLLFQQMNNMTAPRNAEGRLTPDGIRIGSGAKIGTTHSDLSIGSIKETDRALDTVLLEEDYYYPIQVNNQGITETHFTRDGAFYLHPTENASILRLVTKDGHAVTGLTGPIELEDGFEDISIRPNGAIYVTRNGEEQYVDRLTIVRAIRPHLFEAKGNNFFAIPNVDELGHSLEEIIQEVDSDMNLVQSRALEQANVDVAKQMTDLMMTQRSYQMNARTITMADQMMGLVNQIR